MRLTILLAVLLVSVAPGSARALDLDTVRCACADGARNAGDRVACLAQMTRRLVASGQMTATERSLELRRAARAPVPSGGGCLPGAEASLAPLERGWAVMADASVMAPGGDVTARLVYWNESGDDVLLDFSQVSERGCWWELRLVNSAGVIVHQDALGACADMPAQVIVASGDRWERSLVLPLATQRSEAGEPDGTPLAPDLYWLEAVIADIGSPAPVHARGRLPVRIE